MYRYLSPIVLIVWATCSTAAIQNSDFWFHDEGDIVFIDGKRGAPLHIDYIGAPLTKPLTVRVTPNNPKLKIAAPTCTFTKKDDDCRLTVQLKNQSEKVHGVNHFTVTGVGASQGVLKSQAASDASTVGFGVGVQERDMPRPIGSLIVFGLSSRLGAPAKVVAINSTAETRTYVMDSIETIGSDNSSRSQVFILPPKALCYLDSDTLYPVQRNKDPVFSLKFGNGLMDITNPSDAIYNRPFATGADNITSCSARGGPYKCASNKWGSMIVGLANSGSTDMDGGIRAGQIEILWDNSWGNNSSGQGAYIYYDVTWDSNPLVLLQIQGSTDGSENWDVKAATPSIIDIKSAPPCSDYLKPDPSVTYNVTADVYGSGSVKMPEGARCNIITTPHDVTWTRCIGSGLKNTMYEITAVPEAGKTFKGWQSNGLCDDKKNSCRFQLTQNVTIKPYFW